MGLLSVLASSEVCLEPAEKLPQVLMKELHKSLLYVIAKPAFLARRLLLTMKRLSHLDESRQTEEDNAHPFAGPANWA